MLQKIINIAKLAGDEILSEYQKPPVVDWKADDSPLTSADKKAHSLIERELRNEWPEIPLLSEEGMQTPYQERVGWRRFWCVDPMDGTKEFIKKTGQFTVNIALIEGDQLILGVIYAPALNLCYYAEKGKGAFKRADLNAMDQPIFTRKLNKRAIELVASRDHAGPGVKKLIENLKTVETKSMGSSLKFCLVAEGNADAYYRDVPTYEWDTAAAQIILEEAGGVLKTVDQTPLIYNKKDLRNPAILSYSEDEEFWFSMIGQSEGFRGE